MSDRSVALVPVASGYFQSPELFARGRTVDTGLLAEALIFYDRVLVHVDNPHQFADLIIKTAAAFAEWRPKIFGDWYGTEIAKLLKKSQKK